MSSYDPPSGFALRRNGSCLDTETSCHQTWGDFYACCPGNSKCPGATNPIANNVCCPIDSDCTEPLLAKPHCANESWTLFYHDYFCCLSGQTGFWTDNPNNAVGCADEVPSEYHPLPPIPTSSTSSPVPTSSALATSSTSPSAIAPLPTSPPPTKSSNEDEGAIIGGAVGGVIGVTLIIIALWLLRSRQRKKLQAQPQAQPPPSLQPINGTKDSQIPVSELHHQASPSGIGYSESGVVYELPQGNQGVDRAWF